MGSLSFDAAFVGRSFWVAGELIKLVSRFGSRKKTKEENSCGHTENVVLEPREVNDKICSKKWTPPRATYLSLVVHNDKNLQINNDTGYTHK